MMRIVVLLMTFGLATTARQCADNQTPWKNPEIVCQLNERETPLRKFPEMTGQATAAGLADFGKRMNDRFARSEMSRAEAEKIYRLLEKNTFLKNKVHGMPSPDYKPQPIPLKDYFTRIALKKTSAAEYEIFYSYASCGTNYDFLKITVLNDKITNTQLLEGWKGNYPC